MNNASSQTDSSLEDPSPHGPQYTSSGAQTSEDPPPSTSQGAVKRRGGPTIFSLGATVAERPHEPVAAPEGTATAATAVSDEDFLSADGTPPQDTTVAVAVAEDLARVAETLSEMSSGSFQTASECLDASTRTDND